MIKVGHRGGRAGGRLPVSIAVIKLEAPHGALRIVRTADNPDYVRVYVHDCGTEEAASPAPPASVASFVLTLDAVRAFKSVL